MDEGVPISVRRMTVMSSSDLLEEGKWVLNRLRQNDATLDRLCLHSKLIKDVCAKELAEALKTNKTTDLFLKRNGIITAVDAEELAEALRIFL
jgi:hypothetical protein